MTRCIELDVLVAEIERRKYQFVSQAEAFRKIGNEDKESYFAALASNMNSLSCFLNTLEVKEVQEEPISEDLEEAAVNAFKQIVDSGKNNFLEIFKAGAEWQAFHITKNAIEREVKVDAGGYPYIDATELYDYTEDKPLAKAGDKVKLIIIKGE